MKTVKMSRQELQEMKYGDLLQLSRDVGLKTRRLKTEKLIDAILECQNGNIHSDDTEALVTASKNDVMDSDSVKSQEEQIEPVEELLSDIQFPESFSEMEEEAQEVTAAPSKRGYRRKSTINKSDAANDRQIRKRHHITTVDVETKSKSTAEKIVPKRRRTSTYEVSHENRKLTPVIDVSPAINNEQFRKNNELNLLVRRSTKRRTRSSISAHSPGVTTPQTVPINGSHPSSAKASESGAKLSTKLSSSVNVSGDKVPGATPVGESLLDTTVDIKPKTPKSHSIVKQNRLVKTATPSSTRKSQNGGNQQINTPKNKTKLLEGSEITKPTFTIGRDDLPYDRKEGSKDGSSNIPRFLSYVRKLKVPNFAKIHERAFSRMEALDDYVEKKQKLADNVESAKKSQITAEKVFQPTVTSVKNLNLNFASPRSSTRKTPAFSKYTVAQSKSPKPNTSLKVMSSSQKTPKLAQISEKTGKESFPSSSKPSKSPRATRKDAGVTQRLPKNKSYIKKSPRTSPRNAVSVCKNLQKQGSETTSKVTSVKKVSPVRGPNVLSKLHKENVKPVNQSVPSPAVTSKLTSVNLSCIGSVNKRSEYDPKATINKPLNYIPYKGTLKPIADRETLKKMAERKPNLKSRHEMREGQRKILKGVRFNKRFELQMANRGITL